MKVLIVRFAAIGDCVMTAWAATAIRHAKPDTEITWAVQERCSPVIDTDRLVNDLYVFPRERWKTRRWSPATWRDQLVKYTGLRAQRFDAGFDFQGHSKTALCLRLAGCNRRYASRATDALAARLNPPSNLTPTGPHEVELAISLVQKAFDANLPSLPIMPELLEEKAWWRERIVSSEPIVSIQTGAGEPDKTYPVGRWMEVADRLKAKGFQIVSVGGPNDPKLRSPAVLDTVGTQSLTRSLALVAMSDVHLAADTGTGHAAAAYGVPVVSVFGRTDPARFKPWSKKGIVLREGIDTKSVTPEQVVESVGMLLEGRRVARSR